jgi:hypothetical protein
MTGSIRFAQEQNRQLVALYELEFGTDAKINVEQNVQEKLKQIEKDYGSLFCSYIKPETISEIQEVACKDLGLHIDRKYHENIVTPSQLHKQVVVRTKDGANRPLIAIRVELLDERKNKLCEVVELVYKRYSLNGDGKKGGCRENHWVTALSNRSSHAFEFRSGLASGEMTPEQLKRVKDLLEGKTVDTMNGKNGTWASTMDSTGVSFYQIAYYMRLALPLQNGFGFNFI